MSKCLRPGHMLQKSTLNLCRICKYKHHSLLHRSRSRNRENVERINNQSENLENSDISSNRNKISLSAQNIVSDNHVLLSTVVVDIFDFQNKRYKARALLYMGSQSNFITNKFCSILKLKMAPTNVKISGINETHSECFDD